MNRTELKRRWRFFFIDGEPYKLVRVHFATDEATARRLTDDHIAIFSWSDIRRRASRGFKMADMARLLNRSPRVIRRYIQNGIIDPYKMPGKREVIPYEYIFSEEELFKVHEGLLSRPPGPSRLDGGLSDRKNMMSRKELQAVVDHDMVLYTRTSEGKFVPLYLAED